jgi:hypothetical protein
MKNSKGVLIHVQCYCLAREASQAGDHPWPSDDVSLLEVHQVGPQRLRSSSPATLAVGAQSAVSIGIASAIWFEWWSRGPETARNEAQRPPLGTGGELAHITHLRTQIQLASCRERMHMQYA